jgi:hypothetical protein
LKAIGNAEAPTAERGAAVELLGHLRDSEAAAALIKALPDLPRETWGKAGTALEKMTGKRFGPKSGDSLAELTVSLKKWRAWLDEQKKR